MSISITNHYPEFHQQLEGAIAAGLRDAAFIIERGAAEKAPVETGNLRGSIGSESDTNSATIYANAEYSLYQEEGTRYFQGKHFLKDALDEVVPQLDELIQRHV